MIAYREHDFSLIMTSNPTLDGTERDPTVPLTLKGEKHGEGSGTPPGVS